MAQFGNSVNRISGRNLIQEQNHMGPMIEWLQIQQQESNQPEKSETREHHQGSQQDQSSPRQAQ